jgi:hypothetical protein
MTICKRKNSQTQSRNLGRVYTHTHKINVHPVKYHESTEGGVEVQLLLFKLGRRWVRWARPRPCRFTPGKETSYPLHSKLGGPRAQLDGYGKSRPIGFRTRNSGRVVAKSDVLVGTLGRLKGGKSPASSTQQDSSYAASHNS